MQYCTAIIKDTISNAKQALARIKNEIIDSGNIFVMVRTEYDENCDVKNDFFEIIKTGENSNFQYVNTIVVPTIDKIDVELPDNVLYIVWFAKNKHIQFFNKDSMRESHIWKDVEWGKRKKNYNPKGKDPGNVWIPTKDDGKGKITEHILIDLLAIVNRIYLCGHQENCKTLFISNNANDKKCCNENIVFEFSQTKGSNIFSNKKTKSFYENKPIKKRKIFAKVIWGSSENMSEIEKESIDLVVTSPPYWDLKDYYKKGQIGQESYEIYLDRMHNVWKECYDRLTPNGSMWVNINIRIKNNKPILLPKDFAEQCKKIGFYYKGILIWHKSSGIPTHDKNIVDRHEYVLVFSKSKHLTINKKILQFSDYKNQEINGGLFWNINRKAGSVGKQLHPAIYPNGLVSKIVETCTIENQTVLDPFLGSGTTLIASVLCDRNCYGFEYNEGFKSLIQGRIQNEIRLLKSAQIDM